MLHNPTPMQQLHDILTKLAASHTRLDEEDAAQEELADWLRVQHGLEPSDESWQLLYASRDPYAPVVGLAIRRDGLKARYLFDDVADPAAT